MLAWERVFDNLGIVVCTVVLASVCRWWLSNKLTGHRRTLTLIFIFLICRALASTLAAYDVYFHGALTQKLSSVLAFIAWLGIAYAVISDRSNIMRTLRASETEDILRVEAQLDGETSHLAREVLDRDSLERSLLILQPSQGRKG